MNMVNKSSQSALALAALGVVYGDIGTSPLYAFKEAFAHGLVPTHANVLASLSAFFWAIFLVISLKYVVFVIRFDNQGEGGVLALLARAKQLDYKSGFWIKWISVAGVFAAGLFYADAVITPAISVLSAVEGTAVVSKAFESWVIPLTLLILTGLFAIQRFGTQKIGGVLFGPIMILWFVVLGGLGLASVVQNPEVLYALNPMYALKFVWSFPEMAFVLLAAVFLALTGGEAMFADMGHFGHRAVRIAWFGVVWPGLVLNYFGQGALILRNPAGAENPFYLLAPDWALLALVVLSTCATVIASQATIAGAYSMTLQAARLNLLPRVAIRHTSDNEQGQIYIPVVNILMFIGVLILVLYFGSSSALASAYGLAVSGTMLVTTAMIVYLLANSKLRGRTWILMGFVGFACLEVGFFASNLTKLFHGGWVPMLIGVCFCVILFTWEKGQTYLAENRVRYSVPLEVFMNSILPEVAKVEGVAVYLSSDLNVVPSALMHNLKHYRVLHDVNVFLKVNILNVPYVSAEQRSVVREMGGGVFVIEIAFGFREEPSVVPVLASIDEFDLCFDAMRTTYFTSNSKLVDRAGRLNSWQFGIFNAMYKQAASANDYFGLPTNRTVQLGAQVEL